MQVDSQARTHVAAPSHSADGAISTPVADHAQPAGNTRSAPQQLAAGAAPIADHGRVGLADGGRRLARRLMAGAGVLTLGVAAGLGLGALTADGLTGWIWLALGVAAVLLLGQLALAGGSAPTRAADAPIRRLVSRPSATGDMAPDAIVAAFPDPCVIVDRRGVALAVSPATLSLFPKLSVGRPVAFTLRAPEFVAALEEVLNGGPAVTVLVNQRVPVERNFEVVAAPLDGERRRGALVVLRDLTQQQRVEQMRVDFIANASHELRTPLATVMGFIETLQGPARNDPAARERFLAIMREQSLRMKRLIDDLLSLSRIEARAHQAPSARVEVTEVARQIADSLRPMAEEAGVSINFTAPDAPAMVFGDRDELLRVVENLVENAVKYGDAGKRVDIAVAIVRASDGGVATDASRPQGHQRAGGAQLAMASAQLDEVVITVRDYGPGVPPEHVPRLTERFYRVDAQASRGKGGSGLGLAIVRHIVMRHRGRLHIESQPGEGALFRVMLPLAG